MVRRLTLVTQDLLPDVFQLEPCRETAETLNVVETTGATKNRTSESHRSSPEVDSASAPFAGGRINTSRYFSTYSASTKYNEDVSVPLVDTENKCDATACQQSAENDIVELFDRILFVENGDTLRIVFAAVDLFLIASRWCCLHAALRGSRDHFRWAFSSRTETVSETGDRTLSDAMPSRAVAPSTSVGVNGLTVSLSCDRNASLEAEFDDLTEVDKRKQVPCLPCLKCRSRRQSYRHCRGHHAAPTSAIDNSLPTSPAKQYETWGDCVVNFQRGDGNSPTSSSTSFVKQFKLTKMAPLSSTPEVNLPSQVSVSKSADSGLRFDGEQTDDVLGKITTCVVALVLIYVIVATFEFVVREFSARSAAGIITDGDVWRLEEELHGVVKHQVL